MVISTGKVKTPVTYRAAQLYSPPPVFTVDNPIRVNFSKIVYEWQVIYLW